jgi:hypothetical protein
MVKKSKKNTKEITELTVDIKNPDSSVNFIRVEENNLNTTTITNDNNISTTYVEYDINKVTFITKKPLELLDIQSLVALEKACSLLCKRFETTAQLDPKNNAKFKEFKNYYEIIFSELEKRIIDNCKE